MNEAQRKTFEEACRPLMKWMNENCHPHHVVVIDHTNAQLHESQISFNTNEYLRD